MSTSQHAAFDGDDLGLIVAFAGCSLDEKPGSNYVQDNGGLPEYVCEVARAIKRSGKSTSQAIAIALSRLRVWASGGGDVDADTRAKAAKAIAAWDALRARSKAKTAAKKVAASNPLTLEEFVMSDAQLLAEVAGVGPCYSSAIDQVLLSIRDQPSALDQVLAYKKRG